MLQKTQNREFYQNLFTQTDWPTKHKENRLRAAIKALESDYNLIDKWQTHPSERQLKGRLISAFLKISQNQIVKSITLLQTFLYAVSLRADVTTVGRNFATDIMNELEDSATSVC